MIAFIRDNWFYILLGFIACAIVIGTLLHNAPEGIEIEGVGFIRKEYHDAGSEKE